MPWMIGVDEAGYGPNLGPLVVAATLWETPGEPSRCDPWTLLRDAVSQTAPHAGDERFHVADSKQVYSTARGLAGLERGVLAALAMLGHAPPDLGALRRVLTPPGSSPFAGASSASTPSLATPSAPARESASHPATSPPTRRGKVSTARGAPSTKTSGRYRSLFRSDGEDHAVEPSDLVANDAAIDDSAAATAIPPDAVEPWFSALDEPSPAEVDRSEFSPAAARWGAACDACGFRLKAVAADIVFTPRFNGLVDACGNKSTALSRVSLGLIRSLMAVAPGSQGLVLADKHGGRNSYAELLRAVCGGAAVVTLEEGRASSRYQSDAVEFRFEVGAERHLPTALASMTAKYVRELAMRQFNRWWQARRPDVRPTKGYPEDAKRFRAEIASDLRNLNLDEPIYWRLR